MRSESRPRSLLILGAVAIVSCSIFPDKARLPVGEDAGASANPSLGGDAATTGGAGQSTVLGGSGSGGTDGGGSVGSVGEPTSSGGEPPMGLGGAPTTGGVTTCGDRQTQAVVVQADSWIDLARPTQNHGGDNRLHVVSGAMERRSLVRLTLPPAIDGAVLDKATFTLQLARNAEADSGPRQLVLRRLTRRFAAEAVTWQDAEAELAWDAPGGDLGVELARSTVPLGFMSGSVVFDLSARLDGIVNAAERTISFVVLELPADPEPTAQLIFASSEAAAAARPVLTVEYCLP